jgi:metal-responsive CopG/Arc/MetJ family transcriptional regulator
MKIKTSLTISQDLLEALDRLAGPGISRSAFVEEILRDYVEGRAQARREAREIAAINRHAAQLNAEMQDVLSFQADVDAE